MEIIVKKTAYYLNWIDHILEVYVDHNDTNLNVVFKIDDEPVVERTISATEAAGMTDADVIHTVEERYMSEKSAVDKYSDIIIHHSHEMNLLRKVVTYATEYYGASFEIVVEIIDGAYQFRLTNDKTKDVLTCTFEANDVSEVLEKFRIYLSGGIDISHAVTEHLDRLVQQHPLIR